MGHYEVVQALESKRKGYDQCLRHDGYSGWRDFRSTERSDRDRLERMNVTAYQCLKGQRTQGQSYEGGKPHPKLCSDDWNLLAGGSHTLGNGTMTMVDSLVLMLLFWWTTTLMLCRGLCCETVRSFLAFRRKFADTCFDDFGLETFRHCSPFSFERDHPWQRHQRQEAKLEHEPFLPYWVKQTWWESKKHEI